MKRTLLHFAEKLKKPLHILTAFAVIICTAFTVPAFADNSQFAIVPNSSDVRNNGIYLGKYRTYDIKVSADTDDVSVCIVYDIPYCMSLEPFTSYWTYENSTLTRSGQPHVIDEDTVIYIQGPNFVQSDMQLSPFSNETEAYSAFLEYINTPTVTTWVNKPLVIPQGYTAVINTTNMTAGKGGFRLRANTGNLGNSNLWRDIFGNDNVQSGQAVYNTNTPVTSYDFDDYTQLTWSPYEYSLLRATAYEYIGEATKANTYTYIFNPIQGNATSIKNGQNTNSYITLYMNDQFDGTVKLYPLTSMAAVGQGQTIDVGNDESENAGSGDISNGTWTNSDGNVFTPPQGGGNGTGSSQNPLEAIAGTVEHLGEVLNQFVGGLSTILTAPVEAIQTLINNGSAFVSHLSGLYSWLPTQVYSTLTSAIILCITVGVLKVLL